VPTAGNDKILGTLWKLRKIWT